MNRNVGKGVYLFLALLIGLVLAVTPAVFAEGPAPSQPGEGSSGHGQAALAPEAVQGPAAIITVDGSCTDTDGNGLCDDNVTYKTIRAAIAAAAPNDTISVAAGAYTEIGQIVIAKNLTITGASRATTIIKPSADTGGDGDARGWFLVNAGMTFNMSAVTLDGQGRYVHSAIRTHGNGTLDDIAFQNIAYTPGSYDGRGVSAVGDVSQNITISNSTFNNIGRIGVLVFGQTTAVISGNTYTGKGTGDWLDYAFEAGGGGVATISGNTITNCKGLAGDGSTSAGILATTYYGGGTTATIENNWITGNTGAVAVGYNASDTSAVTVHNNDLSGNVSYAVGSTAPSVDASGNWWGSTDPAAVKLAADNGDVEDYTPWLASGTDMDGATAGFQGDFSTLWVDDDSAQTGATGRIQEGINLVSGSTVNVAAGTYDVASTMVVNKALTISGPAGGGAIVQGTNPAAVSIFEITASNVTIQNLEITHNALPAFVSAGWAELPNSLIRIPSGSGLSGIVITGNTIYVPAQSGAMSTWNGVGITVGTGTTTGISITGNTIHNTRNGVVVQTNNTATVSGNIIYDTKGGVMNYTTDQADANHRTVSGNSWGTTHNNEWDIVWNTAYYVPDYQQSVLVLSGANNNAYVLDRRAADAAACAALTGNRSHIFVDDDSTVVAAHPARGNFNEPFKTIALGIEAVVSGGTVYVAAGTYPEQVTIQKSLSLIGAGEATTTILAPATRTGTVTHGTTVHDYLLAAYATSDTIDVRVEGFTLDVNGKNKTAGTGQMDGVFFRDVKDVAGTMAGLFSSTIHNFAATPNYEGFGVVVYGSSLLTLNDNNISDYTRDGISINRYGGSGSDPNVTISNNTITGSATPLNGINIATVTHGAVTGNTVTGNTRTGADPCPDCYAAGGIVLWTSTGVPITGNHVNGNFYGINLQAGSHDITISGNELTGNIKRGITLDDSDNNTVSGNTIAGPVGGTDDVGIGVVNTSTGNMIGGPAPADGNTITMASSGSANLYAIHMQGDAGAGNTIRYNTITGGQRAVQFDGPPGITGITTVSNNVISGQAFGGIVAYNNGGLVITDNTLTNAVRPIEFFGPVDVTITGNTINGSTYAGINLGAFSGTATLSGNTIHGIADNNGIWAQTSGAGLNITGNTIYDISGTGGAGRGIQIDPAADGANIDGNEIYNITGFSSIVIDTGATGAKINNNDIHNNEQGVVANEQTAEFHGNRILNNRWGIDLNSTGSTFTLLHNQIAGNNTNPGDSYGLSVWAGTAIAEENWWGSASGPGTVGPGSGDHVSAYVDYSPWCINVACSAFASEGPGGTTIIPPGTPAVDIQAVITAASSGDVIVLPTGTIAVPGGFTISTPGITIKLSNGTVIQASSPCFIVSADDVTIKSDTTFLTGGVGVCEPNNGDHGIQTGKAVNNLVIRDIEIRKGSGATGDGIHIGHNVTNLQILDNYIHTLDGDGIEYAAGVVVSGVHEVQGNLFQGNAGSGVNNASTTSYVVEYNSWGDIGGPNVGSGDGAVGLLDFSPWTHVGLSMVSSVSPVADKVAVGQEIVYTIKMDAAEVYGTDFDLNFNKDRLEAVSFTNSGTFAQTADCKLNSVADANANGVLSFCGSRVSTGVLNGSGQDVFEVRFRGKSGITAPTVVPLNLDESDDQFAMSPPTGASTNIYAAALADGSVTVYPIFTVTGRIDLQGRADDTGAVMTFAQGSGADGPHYGPFTFSTSDYWGAISKAAVVEDTYGITVSMAKYLDVTTASNKSVSINNAKQALNTLTLFGGDVGGGFAGAEDDRIDISDAGIIGGVYGTSTASGDVNGDGTVDILDLVLVGGNFDKQSSVALGNAYAAWAP